MWHFVTHGKKVAVEYNQPDVATSANDILTVLSVKKGICGSIRYKANYAR